MEKEMEKEKNMINFEGEYLNGYRWNGKEKRYDLDGKLEREVVYLNGEKLQ